jgi:hypothetical protein
MTSPAGDLGARGAVQASDFAPPLLCIITLASVAKPTPSTVARSRHDRPRLAALAREPAAAPAAARLHATGAARVGRPMIRPAAPACRATRVESPRPR